MNNQDDELDKILHKIKFGTDKQYYSLDWGRTAILAWHNKQLRELLRSLPEVVSALSDSDKSFIEKEEAVLKAEVAWNDVLERRLLEARIDELDWARNEVECDSPINVYDKISIKMDMLSKLKEKE